MKKSVWFVLFFFLFGCVSKEKSGDIFHLVVLHTNDTHGHAWPIRRKDGITRGGYAVQAKVIEDIRKEISHESGAVIVLSGGDVNTGFPESDYFLAEPDFLAMEKVGYDAMVVGNHELDNGLGVLLKQKALVSLPILSANVVKKGTTVPLFEPYKIIERDGVKLGVLGLTTDSLRSLVMPKHVKDLDALDPVTTAKRYIPQLRAAGADILIALTHVGINLSDSRRVVVIERDEPSIVINNPEISLLIGGHSHTLLPEGTKIGSSLLAQAGDKGEYLGRVDLLWHRREKRVVEARARVIPLNLELGESNEIKTFLASYWEKSEKLFSEVIAHTDVDLDGDAADVRTKETNLGNLICDVIRAESKADVAVFNGGGIRASIPKGDITIRDALRTFPFHNTIVTARFTGKELRNLLQSAVKNRMKAGGSFLHVSGLKYEINAEGVGQITFKNRELRSEEVLLLATNSFVLAGGDGLEVHFIPNSKVDLGILVEKTFTEYLRKVRKISPRTDGRIRFISEGPTTRH